MRGECVEVTSGCSGGDTETSDDVFNENASLSRKKVEDGVESFGFFHLINLRDWLDRAAGPEG